MWFASNLNKARNRLYCFRQKPLGRYLRRWGCIKQEGFQCKGERGVYFKTCTYEEINEYITKNGYDNHYLDRTSGYYTYLKDYDCVLAHYNWHPLSRQEVTNPVENLKIMEETFNRRLKRLLQMIRKGQHLHIFWHTNKREQFLRINNKSYDLNKTVVERKLISFFSIWKKKQITFHQI